MRPGRAEQRSAIRRIGALARRALREGAAGTVGAVFERSFYVVVDGQWVCLAPPAAGMGPLNACFGEPRDAVPRVGEPVAVRHGAIHAGPAAFSFRQAVEWTPAKPPPWDAGSLARGLAAFDAALPPVPAEGLAPFVRGDPSESLSAVQARAAAPMRHLRALTQAGADADRPDFDALLPLVGLGPGLTPSGDDVLGGALIAWSLTAAGLRDAAWPRVAAAAESSTGLISRAHLEAAAAGCGHEALHAILNAILGGEDADMAARIRRIAAVGHTSGWDALAGAVTVLRARRDAATATC